jgi:hypothetical protein
MMTMLDEDTADVETYSRNCMRCPDPWEMTELDRCTFLLLLAALAVTTTAKAVTSPCCQVCGAAMTRGSRAQKLAALGQCPEDQLCLNCLASQMTERVPECDRCSAPFIHDERAARLAALVSPKRELCFDCLLSFIHVGGTYAPGDSLMIRVRMDSELISLCVTEENYAQLASLYETAITYPPAIT